MWRGGVGGLACVAALACATSSAPPGTNGASGAPRATHPATPAGAPQAAGTPASPPAPAPAPRQPSPADHARYEQLVEQATQAESAGDINRALQLLGQAKQLMPAEPSAYFGAGLMLYRAGRVSAAAPEFKRTLELAQTPNVKQLAVDSIRELTEQPRSDEETKQLRLAYEAIEAHHADRALPHLQRALDLNPRNARTRYEIGYAYVELARVDDAIPHFEEARKINPVSREVLTELQFCYGDRKRYAELGGVIRDLLLLDGETPGLLHELAYSYASQGNTAVAIAGFEDNLRRHPTFYLSHFPLAEAYCDGKRDVAKGRAHLESFVRHAEADLRKPAAQQTLLSRPKLEATVRDARDLLATCGR